MGLDFFPSFKSYIDSGVIFLYLLIQLNLRSFRLLIGWLACGVLPPGTALAWCYSNRRGSPKQSPTSGRRWASTLTARCSCAMWPWWVCCWQLCSAPLLSRGAPGVVCLGSFFSPHSLVFPLWFWMGVCFLLLLKLVCPPASFLLVLLQGIIFFPVPSPSLHRV